MKPVLILCTAVLLAMTLAFNVSAQQSDYHLQKDAIYTGGQTATGGSYQMQGTVGQANVGVLSGGGFQLTSGFWHPADKGSTIYLPIVQR